MLSVLFWISFVIVVALVVIPIARFLLYQWGVRRSEFLSRLNGKTLSAYLSRFHANAGVNTGVSEIDIFKRDVYDKFVGRHLYIVPAILLFAIVLVLAGIVIATAIRSGYEEYVVFYKGWLQEEGGAASAISIGHRRIVDIDSAVWPFQDIALDLPTLAAISGAYLYVVGVVIQGFRARTLTSSDLLWCSFRMIIAVPLGLSLSEVANSAVSAFIAFALGAFPIEAINRILRHILNKSLNQSDDDKADQLIKLAGVTPDVSALLGGEGITAVQQLASHDPVALAIRTGLPFDYVLNLISQSQAWCYLGSTAGTLIPLALGDAPLWCTNGLAAASVSRVGD
jgi:hypothetical protein